MPERLDFVEVATGMEMVTLSWEAREGLLAQLPITLDPVRTEFENAGASRPVKIPEQLKGAVIEAIDVWGKSVGGPDGLPAGIHKLRNALMDEPDT